MILSTGFYGEIILIFPTKSQNTFCLYILKVLKIILIYVPVIRMFAVPSTYNFRSRYL